jgi:hypothetical protein
VRLVQCKLIMNDDRNLGQLHFAGLWDFPSSWTMIGFPFSTSPSMSCNSLAESSVSTMVLVIDMNHTCLRIRSWTDVVSSPKIFAKLYAWRFAKGMFAHHHQALVFYFFRRQKGNTHAHFVCAVTKQEAHMCVCANVFSTHLGSCM